MSTLSASAASGPPLPVTAGQLYDFPRDPIGCMRRLRARHGDVAALREGPTQIVFGFGPQYNQQIQTDTETFLSTFFAIRGPKKSAQRRLTSGLLSMNGEQHKRNRRMVKEPFSRKSIEGYQDALTGYVGEMLDGWRPGETRDIFRDMTQYMLRVTSTVLFGFDQNDLALRIGRMTERWVQMNHRLGIGALVPHQDFRDEYEEFLRYAEGLEEAILEMIRLRRAGAAGHDVLSLLVRSYDEQGGMSDEELIGQAAILFGAAHLTTANTLSWTLLLLAQHPSVMRELHAELRAGVAGDVPTLAELPRLETTERVIKESMRVLPASSYLQRTTSRPVEFGPLQLAAGTTVIFSQFMTHHMAELYDEPERFLPDRWKTIHPSPYEYFPFGAGARMCLGGPLAMLNLKSTLPAILKRFRLTTVAGSEVSGLVTSTMLTPTTPIPMRIDHQDGRFAASPIGGNIHELVDLVETPTAAPRAA